jgi:hypothetical protein
MKKLIFLMLVVGIASAANAMTLDLVHGDADTVDIVATNGYTVGDDIYWALVGNSSEVILSGGIVGAVAPADTGIYGYDAQANGMCATPLDGVWGFIGDIAGQSTGPGTYIDEIEWTLVGNTTYTWVSLITTVDWGFFVMGPSLLVPEPMTLALLGLGGLMLLRRRR